MELSDTLKNIQINSSVLYDLLQTESCPTSFICTPFYVSLLPCGLTLKYCNSSPNMVLPITFENNCVRGKILVNAEKFTDMQVHVGRYTAAMEANSISRTSAV